MQKNLINIFKLQIKKNASKTDFAVQDISIKNNLEKYLN